MNLLDDTHEYPGTLKLLEHCDERCDGCNARERVTSPHGDYYTCRFGNDPAECEENDDPIYPPDIMPEQ